MHLEILTTNLHKAWFDSPADLSFIDLPKIKATFNRAHQNSSA